MILLHKAEALKPVVDELRKQGKRIGFVPTMGALHQGHLSLLHHAIAQNDFNIVSIFVNPTQFNNPDDLKKYPRMLEIDQELLCQAGCDAVFVPDVEEIYPEGELTEKFDFKGLERQMEGRFRPGHFDGVGTVVKRLFEIVKPDNAYFGEKDFQQLRIIQQLVENQKLKVNIVPVPIKREEDGLAMSSRNLLLSPEMRKEAPVIFEILNAAKDFFIEHSAAETKKFVENLFEQSLLQLEYFEIADEETLQTVEDRNCCIHIRAFVAAFADDIRLIDNLRFQ